MLIGTCVQFESRDYKILESVEDSVDITLMLSGQPISQSFNVTVIASVCTSSAPPDTGYHDIATY